MIDELNRPAARVVEITRRPNAGTRDLTVCGDAHRPLTDILATLRSEMDGLTIRLAREHGRSSEATLRAEQISNAIQRLEWALDREEPLPAN